MWCHWAAKDSLQISSADVVKHYCQCKREGSVSVCEKAMICLQFVCACHTFDSFWHMHQQVLLSRGRVAVGRLQALVLCVKVRHSDSSFSLTK